MSRLLWTFAWAGVAVWSLFALGAYGLVDLIGGLMARSADALASNPETVAWLLEHACDAAQGFHFARPAPWPALVSAFLPAPIAIPHPHRHPLIRP